MMAMLEAVQWQAVSALLQEVLPMAVMKQVSCAWCVS